MLLLTVVSVRSDNSDNNYYKFNTQHITSLSDLIHLSQLSMKCFTMAATPILSVLSEKLSILTDMKLFNIVPCCQQTSLSQCATFNFEKSIMPPLPPPLLLSPYHSPHNVVH